MLNVMIAEDNIDIANCYQNYLANEKNIEVIGVALDGRTALDIYNEKHPDLVLLDLDLPVLNGLSFIEQVTQYSDDKSSNIIVVSGNTDLRLKLTNMKKVYRSVSKPLDFSRLVDLINEFDLEFNEKAFPDKIK